MQFRTILLLCAASQPHVFGAVARNPTTRMPSVNVARQEARKSTEEKSFALLYEVIEEAGALRRAENRSLVLALAADLLWAYDAKRARAAFKEAAESLAEVSAHLQGDGKQPDGLAETYAAVRLRMMEIVARHDPKSARDFLRSTSQPSQPDDTRELNLDLAAQLISSDPQQALRMAMESLDGGVSYRLLELLPPLEKRDHKAAAELATGVLARLRAENLMENHEAAILACELLRLETEAHGSGAREEPGPEPLLDRTALKELARVIMAAALQARVNNPELLFALQPLMPEVEKLEPVIAQRLNSNIMQMRKTLSEQNDDSDAPESEAVSQPPAEDARRSVATDRAKEIVGEAISSAEKGDKELALRLLNETAGTLRQPAQDLAQLNAQLLVAHAYIIISEPERSFALVEPLINQANDLAAAASVVSGFLIESHLVSDDELSLLPVFELYGTVLPESIPSLFAALAAADYERTKALVDRLQRNETRVAAHLMIAQSVLSGRPGKGPHERQGFSRQGVELPGTVSAGVSGAKVQVQTK